MENENKKTVISEGVVNFKQWEKTKSKGNATIEELPTEGFKVLGVLELNSQKQLEIELKNGKKIFLSTALSTKIRKGLANTYNGNETKVWLEWSKNFYKIKILGSGQKGSKVGIQFLTA